MLIPHALNVQEASMLHTVCMLWKYRHSLSLSHFSHMKVFAHVKSKYTALCDSSVYCSWPFVLMAQAHSVMHTSNQVCFLYFSPIPICLLSILIIIVGEGEGFEHLRLACFLYMCRMWSLGTRLYYTCATCRDVSKHFSKWNVPRWYTYHVSGLSFKVIHRSSYTH